MPPREIVTAGPEGTRLPVQSGNLELPLGIDASVVRVSSLPQTPADFRRALGLPDEPVFSPQEDYREKRHRVEKYAVEHSQVSERDRYANGLVSLNYKDSRIQGQLADRSLSIRFWRGLTEKLLSRSGIKNSREVLKAVEESIPIYQKRDVKPAILASLIKTLDPNNEEEALRKFNLAISRSRQFYVLPPSSDFEYQDEFIDMMATMGNLPEEDFQRVYHQLDGRTEVLFHNNYFCAGYGQPENNGLLKILKQGGLTTAQQHMLDQANVWITFAQALPPIKVSDVNTPKEKDFGWWVDYNQLFDPEVAAKIDKYYPYLIDWAAGRLPVVLAEAAGEPPPFHKNTCGGRDFIVGVQLIDSVGNLVQLNRLRDAGWDLDGIYSVMDGAGYFGDIAKHSERINEALVSVALFASDPDKVAWAKAFSKFYYGDALLLTNTNALQTYENMVRSRDALITSAFILNSLPRGPEDPQFAELLILDEGRAGIDKYKLWNLLGRLSERVDVSDVDKAYVKSLENLLGVNREEYHWNSSPEPISADRLPFLLYSAMNKDRIVNGIFDSEGNLFPHNASVINGLSDQQIPVYAQLMKDLISRCNNQEQLSPCLKLAYFDSLRLENRVEVLVGLSDDLLATMGEEDQALITFFRQLPEGLQRLITYQGKDALLQNIKGGKPTPLLLESALDRGMLGDVRQFITEELLGSFNSQEREFWQTCLGLPPKVLLSFAWCKPSWKEYFTDGKVTPAFLTRVAVYSKGEEIDQLLAVTDLSHLSTAEQTFWNFYKNIPQNPKMRKYLLKAPDQFPQLVSEGRPTVQFLEAVAKEGDVATIKEVLPYIKVNELPAAERAFWEFYPQIDRLNTSLIRNYLLLHRDKFAGFITDGRPNLSFLNEAASLVIHSHEFALIGQILDQVEIDKLPVDERDFWTYYQKNASVYPKFILANKANFKQMVVNGQETPLFYKFLATEEPTIMLNLAKTKRGLTVKQYQDLWRSAVGQEAVDSLLAALPKATDEARNAFTQNDYDRTTAFITYLFRAMPTGQFSLNAENFSVMAAYIQQFGLARNEAMYKYFRALHLFEKGQLDDLPSDMKTLGITSTAEMVRNFSEVRKMVFAETQLTDVAQLRNLTPFQIQVLANVTRYDSARWGGGDEDNLSSKIIDFAVGLEQGLIVPLPPGYQSESIAASSVRVEFNADAVRGDYNVLREEILESIDNPPTADHLKSQARLVIERRIDKIQETLGRVTNERAIAGILKDLSNYRTYLSQLEGVSDIDALTLTLLGMRFSNEDRSGSEGFAGIDSIMRRIILSKLYQARTRSPGFLENVRIKLSKDDITAEGIDEIVLTVDEMIKNHVLGLDQKDREKYWRGEIIQAILANGSLRKNFRKITESFNPHAEKLRQEQAKFVRTQTGKVSQIRIIPDRGLVGEMAGYLADVCYVRVGNMLRRYSGASPEEPLVVPFKFVTMNPETNDPAFVGSVLVFEVQTAAGESALLVRALDIPNESDVDVSKFTENLLDNFTDLARKRGKSKVLVAGTAGTISNYSAITSHILREYVTGKDAEPVSPDFDFNGYDITDHIYTARVIK